MREMYGSHLKLMDLFRPYVGAPSASAVLTISTQSVDQAANKREWVFIDEKLKKKQHICNVWSGDRSREVCNKRQCNPAVCCPRTILQIPVMAITLRRCTVCESTF